MNPQTPISDASYHHFLSEKKLMGSACQICGALYLPPRSLCARCYGSEMEWVEMKGRGALVAFTCIFVAPPVMMKKGYGRDNPYCSGVVEIEGSLRVVARIVGVTAVEPESIGIGTPMRVCFTDVEDDACATSLAFEPTRVDLAKV